MNLDTIVRPSDGRLALLRDRQRVAELAAQRFPVEGLEATRIGWDEHLSIVRLKVNGEWGPAAAWQAVNEPEENT